MASALPASLTPNRLRELASALHEVTVPLRQPSPGVQRRWFQGPNATDLILDFAGNRLARIELTFAGFWLAVEEGKLGTGRSDDLQFHGERPVSKLITRDLVRSDPVVSAARAMFEGLDESELRDALLSTLPAP